MLCHWTVISFLNKYVQLAGSHNLWLSFDIWFEDHTSGVEKIIWLSGWVLKLVLATLLCIYQQQLCNIYDYKIFREKIPISTHWHSEGRVDLWIPLHNSSNATFMYTCTLSSFLRQLLKGEMYSSNYYHPNNETPYKITSIWYKYLRCTILKRYFYYFLTVTITLCGWNAFCQFIFF